MRVQVPPAPLNETKVLAAALSALTRSVRVQVPLVSLDGERTHDVRVAFLVANENVPVQVRLGALTTVPHDDSLQTLLTFFPKETLSNSQIRC